MVRVCGAVVPTALVLSCTVIEALPKAAMSAAAIGAVSCVALTWVVDRALPYHCTTDCAVKLLPVAVRVKAAPVATAEDGESAVSCTTLPVTVYWIETVCGLLVTCCVQAWS